MCDMVGFETFAVILDEGSVRVAKDTMTERTPVVDKVSCKLVVIP